jgi:hypothetical protein
MSWIRIHAITFLHCYTCIYLTKYQFGLKNYTLTWWSSSSCCPGRKRNLQQQPLLKHADAVVGVHLGCAQGLGCCLDAGGGRPSGRHWPGSLDAGRGRQIPQQPLLQHGSLDTQHCRSSDRPPLRPPGAARYRERMDPSRRVSSTSRGQ